VTAAKSAVPLAGPGAAGVAGKLSAPDRFLPVRILATAGLGTRLRIRQPSPWSSMPSRRPRVSRVSPLRAPAACAVSWAAGDLP
jgi:hypothetical protein